MINAKTPHQLMEIYNQLPCACITVDAFGKIVNANDAFLNCTGFDREQILNVLNIEDFLPPENYNHINHLTDPLQNQKNNPDISYVNLITKEQNRIPCTISSMVLNIETDLYYYYSFIDFGRTIITDNAVLDEKIQMKIAEQKLIKLTLELQNITNTISQEIQNPLQNILGLITLLKQNYIDSFNSTGLVFMDHIGDSGEKMRHHFDVLLKNATNGKSVIDKKYIDLNVIIKEVKLQLYEQIVKYNVNLNLPRPLPSVFGIEKDLRKLFVNLINNAIHFKEENTIPIINISFVEDISLYHFTIEDNGIGIEEAYQEKVFEAYFKINHDDKDCSGLGLPESRKIVESHNGAIGVVSNKNKGCTVYFSLEK